MIIKAKEKGQALILIALASIGLFAFAALAIDGTRAYSNKRHAQNAADTAALAGAPGICTRERYRSGGPCPGPIKRICIGRLIQSGNCDYHSNVPNEADCPGDVMGKDITVTIVSHLNTTFAKILGRNQIDSGATATSRACGFDFVPLFNGDAIVGLKPDTAGGCAVDTGNSNAKSWTTRGGGVFSNSCLEHPNGTLNVPNNKCITTVGNANTSGGGTHNCVQENLGADAAYAFPADITSIMPPDPCTGAITGGRYASGGKVPTTGQTNFDNDVFCISDFSTLNDHIVLNNATLYVTDTSFSTRFNGGGNTGFFGTASNSGVYQGYYLIVKLLSKAAADRCDQYFDFRGNGNLQMVGTILAPSTCLDYRGNSTGYSTHSQMIFYQFTSNGNATIDVTYQEEENHRTPYNPSITVLR